MPHGLFDSFQFKEVLATSASGNPDEGWVTVKMPSYTPAFAASDAFSTGSKAGALVTRGSTGETHSSSSAYAVGSGTFDSYGPFFVDPFHIGCNWMWAGGGQTGFVEGYPSGVSSGCGTYDFGWAWYGRGGIAGCDA